ncbi:MAG: hypothetical protein HOW73_08585 [Polyangiaceae bacterium]|nr:hypothetical protein [Polyangiaceae bacterium]
MISVWRRAARMEHVAAMAEASRDMLTPPKGPVTFVAVIEPTSPPPEGTVRDELAKWSRDVVPKMALAVFVAEGSGFRSALVRGVGTALSAVVPSKVPFKFVSNIGEALPLVTPFLPKAETAEGLRDAIAYLRDCMNGA